MGPTDFNLEKNQKAVALQTLQVVAARANQPGAVRTTRCFVVQSKKDETTKWIAAANGDPELSMALRACKQINPLKHWSGESDGSRPTVTSGKRRWRVGLPARGWTRCLANLFQLH